MESAPVVREKAATVVCQVGESGGASEALLVSEGVLPPLVKLAESGSLVGRQKAAITLQRLSASSPDVARAVVGHGGADALVEICQAGDSVSQYAAAGELRNLSAVPEVRQALADEGIVCVMIGLLGRGAVSEHGCIPLLVRLLEAKSSGAREVGAQALASLVSCPANAREMKKDDKCVPSLVQLLEPSPANTKKYAIACLLTLSGAKRCKKVMVSHGAIGYLKKLSDMGVAGTRRKLHERLERGSLRSMFSRQ